MKNRNISVKQALIIVPLVFVGIIVLGGTIAELSGSGDAPQAAPTVTQTAAFDVPSLVGMNVDQIRQALGQPQDGNLTEPTSLQLEMGTTEWDNTFENDGQSLLVTFNPTTRTVIDFFISTTDPSGATKDKQALLRAGNLTENDARYTIEFVRALNDRTVYTGVKVIPR